jgi:hypothetical protein
MLHSEQCSLGSDHISCRCILELCHAQYGGNCCRLGVIKTLERFVLCREGIFSVFKGTL